uniref:Uncharacterized protein n=1 Tax=Aegilops tauschii TaxID=37682 RepID=M8CGB1_AEGTA
MDEYGWGFLDGVASIILFLFAKGAIDDIGQCILAKIQARGNPQAQAGAAGGGGGQAEGAVPATPTVALDLEFWIVTSDIDYNSQITL